jgi:hypothetical protein
MKYKKIIDNETGYQLEVFPATKSVYFKHFDETKEMLCDSELRWLAAELIGEDVAQYIATQK